MTIKIQQNISLKPYNTFGIAAKAQYFCEVNSTAELEQLLLKPNIKPLQKLVLGSGSNMLFTQDYLGLVIKIGMKDIAIVDESPEHYWLKIGAGFPWHQLVLYCITHNYAGIENLSLIPGTVGAAPVQNIGAYGVELTDVFDSLEAVNLTDGRLQVFTHEQCQFGYRESIFKQKLHQQYAICTVTLRLNKQPKFNLDYGDIQQTLTEMKVKELSLKAVSDAVIAIRSAKLPDTTELGNAGSFFKNPTISKAQATLLQEHFPSLPIYSLPDPEHVKIAAAWLIDQCGFKGHRQGDAGVHAKQALVLVNYGNASGLEIKHLASTIRATVYQRFGIELETEVNCI